jgi:hypothetical protein
VSIGEESSGWAEAIPGTFCGVDAARTLAIVGRSLRTPARQIEHLAHEATAFSGRFASARCLLRLLALRDAELVALGIGADGPVESGDVVVLES